MQICLDAKATIPTPRDASRLVPRTTAEEERELFAAHAAGTMTTSDLVERFLWLVPANMGKFSRHWRFIEDIEQEAVLGLYRAVEAFDASSGYRFSTYAAHSIVSSCYDWMRSNANPIRVPKYARSLVRKAEKGEPLPAGDGSQATLEAASRVIAGPIIRIDSLDEHGGLIPDHSKSCAFEVEEADFAEVLERSLSKCLSERDYEIVRMRFIEGKTLDACGKAAGLTRERSRQIVLDAVAYLKSGPLARLARMHSE